MKNSEKFPLDPVISRDLKKYLSFIWDDIKGEDPKFLCAGGFPRYIGLLQIALNGDERAQILFEDWEILKNAIINNLSFKDVKQQLLSLEDQELFETYSMSNNAKFHNMPFYLARFFIAPYIRKEAFENRPEKSSISEKNESELTLKGHPNFSDRDIDIFIKDEISLLDFVLRLKESIYVWINQNRKIEKNLFPLKARGNAALSPVALAKRPQFIIRKSKMIPSSEDCDSDTDDSNLMLPAGSSDPKSREYWDGLLEDMPKFLIFEDEIPAIVEKNKQKDIKFIEDNIMRGIRSIEDVIVREKILYWIFHDINKLSLYKLSHDAFEDIETTHEKFVSHELDINCYKFCLGIFREIYIPVLEGKMSIEDASYHLQCIEGEYISCNFVNNYDTKCTKYATSVLHEMTKFKNLVKFLNVLIESMPENIDVKRYIKRIERDVSLINLEKLQDGNAPDSQRRRWSEPPPPQLLHDSKRELFSAWKNYCWEIIKLPKMQFITGDDLLFRDENSLFDNFDIQNCVWKMNISSDDAASIEVSKDALCADLGQYFKLNHGRSLFTSNRLRKYSSRERRKKILYSDDSLREWCNNLFFESFEKENSRDIKYSKSKIREIASFWDIPHDIVCMFVGSFDIKQLEEIEEHENISDFGYGTLAKRATNKKLVAKKYDWAMTYMSKQEEKQKGEKNDKD